MSELMGFLLWLDRCVNAVLGGSFGETLSARAHRMEVSGHPYWGWTARAIDWLFFWEPDHCRKQWERERAAPLPDWKPAPLAVLALAVLATYLIF